MFEKQKDNYAEDQEKNHGTISDNHWKPVKRLWRLEDFCLKINSRLIVQSIEVVTISNFGKF
jgi:hypothetical protein